MKTVTDNFLKEINKSSWYPIRRAYMLDNLSAEVEITDKVADFDRVLWQIEQGYRLNEFVASNCRLSLKNLDEEFDIDNASNFFVATLSQPQDGYKVPVQIKVGYTLPDGTEELVSLFRGYIVDIAPSTDDDIVEIELQCISRLLRDADTDDFGDEWTTESLYGGTSHSYLDGAIASGDTTIDLVNVPTGNFPSGFPQFGYVLIEGADASDEPDEIIYFGRWTASGLEGCLRGQLGTKPVAHANTRKVYVRLADGSNTGDNETKFQFPGYPISIQSISSLVSSDGAISLIDSRQFLGLTDSERKVTGWVDYENGVLELAETPTSSSSILATFKTAYRKMPFHTLAKRLLDKESFDTSLVDDCVLLDYLARSVPSSYGRVMFADDGGTPTALPIDAECLAICVGSDDTVYLGIDTYLIQWDGEQFNLLADLGGTDYILRLQGDAAGNIYGIAGDKNGSALRDVFRWNGTIISTLSSSIAAYYDPIIDAGGGQWRNFSVDTTNSVIWFIYDDAVNYGIAKINFDGTGLTKYSRSAFDNFMIDFVDIGATIECFYCATSGPNKDLQYDTLTKATGLWAANGALMTNANSMSPVDITYHSGENKIYLNVVLVSGTDGWLTYTTVGSAVDTVIQTYGSPAAQNSRYAGGMYHDGYVWAIMGNEYAEGGSSDNATGHLYRIAAGAVEDLGAMGLRPDGTGAIRGHSAVMSYRISDNALFFISTDLSAFLNFDFGYLFSRYSPYLATVIDIANVNGRKIWDVLSELAVLANYELGVTSEGKVFWRKRSSGVTLLNGGINASVTTIPTDGTEMDAFSASGMISIDSEVIEYTGKTASSFTGGTRGARGSTAASHLDNAEIWEIHQVIANLEPNQNTLKRVKKLPNWDEIYNYITVPYGDYEVAFNYATAEETFAGSSEETYGRRQLNIANQLLTSQDGLIAEAIGWRYYAHYNLRRSLIEVETKWQPHLDVGDQIVTNQGSRVLLDYRPGRIRRIEIAMKDFYIRLTALLGAKRYVDYIPAYIPS